jgi:hypothetical protein
MGAEGQYPLYDDKLSKSYRTSSRSTIAIDCGPSFHERACQEFPRNGLGRIDGEYINIAVEYYHRRSARS